MARPLWKPDRATPKQRELLHAAIAAADEADAITEAAQAKVWAAIEAARAVGVPMRYLATHTRRSKSSAYRRLGARTTDEPQAT